MSEMVLSTCRMKVPACAELIGKLSIDKGVVGDCKSERSH